MLIDERQIGIFTIKTYALEEQRSPQSCVDGEPVDELIEGIESGKYVWFMAKVTAECEGVVLTAAYLGSCCYDSFEDFANGKDVHESMIDEVLDTARLKLDSLVQKASSSQ